MTNFRKLGLLASAAAVAALSAGAGAAEDVVLPSEVAATHWKTNYQNDFAALVNERTGGELQVKVFPAGQLYNEQDALAALGTGAVHMVWPVSVRLESIEPSTGVLSLPFAITDEMMTNDCYSKGLTEIMSQEVEPRNLKVLGLLRTADLLFIFKDHEVKSMDDLEGTKVRVTGGRVFLDTMDTLGISGVSMAASEMSTAMSQGAIDGVYSSPAGWAEMIGMTGNQAWHVPGFQLSTYAVVVDKMWFDGLSPEFQEAITTSLDEISKREWVEAKAADEELLKKMVDQGAVINTPDEVELEKWRELSATNAADFNKEHAEVVTAVAELGASCGVAG